MKTVHKFGPFDLGESYEIACDNLFHFGYQGHYLYIWGEPVDKNINVITIYGTGHDIPDNQYWLGTAVSPGGFVWHCYVQTL